MSGVRNEHEAEAGGVYGGARGRKPGWTAEQHRHSARYDRGGGYVPKSTEVQQRLLGIDWMTKGGMAQSLPPVYTEHLGRQVIEAIDLARVGENRRPGLTFDDRYCGNCDCQMGCEGAS